MCCFSGGRGAVREVSGTRIFARADEGNLQVLVYEMRVALRAPVAMVLPLPVALGSGENALRFVSLQAYPQFFDVLERAFPLPLPPKNGPAMPSRSAAPRLQVHQVGDFVASYVPSAADFGRLDPRFRLAPGVLESLPQYRDWGFAVFQLDAVPAGLLKRLFGPKPPRRRIHPMAFVFPRRDPESLFFPTVHVHDGAVHPKAKFDHTLYLQTAESVPSGWLAADQKANEVLDLDAARGLVSGSGALGRREIKGVQTNEDVRVELGPTVRGPVGAIA